MGSRERVELMGSRSGQRAYGSRGWDDMRKKRLKRAYGSKAWDDMYAGSGRSGRSGEGVELRGLSSGRKWRKKVFNGSCK